MFVNGRFVDRPGESTPRAATAAPTLPSGSESGGEAGTDAPDASFLTTLGNLLRRPGQGGGGGGGGGFGALGFVAQAFGRAPAGGGGFGGFGGVQNQVTTGDYLVTITVDGKTLSRVLRVERGR